MFSGAGLARPLPLYKDGALTATGVKLRVLGWRPPVDVPHVGMPTQMHGNREYVSLPSGREVMTRRWRPAQGSWDLTQMGRQMYGNTLELVVEVPVRIVGVGRGRVRTYRTNDTYLPISSTLAPRLNEIYAGGRCGGREGLYLFPRDADGGRVRDSDRIRRNLLY